ncbi:MAG: type II secretion system minor pseudopilin GspK [Alphaproteobacteria bacterium]|nr:type II secretion system minor pseudopilin GspK [Alphaproteobacteria bacterium]
MKPGERGAALINVLVLVGIMAALSTSLFDRLRLARHLDASRAAIDAARSAALAAEPMIAARLPLPRVPAGAFRLETPAGAALVRLAPGGNCFNLNSTAMGPAGRTATRPLGVEQLARLLGLLDVPADEAQRIASATADWIDSDQQPGSGGAEDAAYARAATPYRTASLPLAEPSEWRAVAGVTAAIFARAAPHLCALPETELSRPNINSLVPADAPVLAAIANLPLATAREAIAARPATGWASPDQFWTQPLLAGRQLPADVLRQIDVKDRFIAFSLETRLAGATPGLPLEATGLFDAGTRPARLLVRRWGPET